MKIDGLALRRGGRAARRQVRRPAAPRGRATSASDRPKGPQRQRLIEANRVAQEFYAEQLGRPTRWSRASSSPSAASTRTPPPTFGVGFAPARRRGAAQAPAPEAASPRRSWSPPGWSAIGRSAYDRFRGRLLWPIRDAQRRHDRLRRAADLRRRPDRGEVPQHPRDPDLQEEPGALRHRPGPPRDRAVVAGGRGRGLHRRDGLPPRRRRHRGRHLRHRLRRRPRAGAAPVPARPRGVPRRGDLHLRRRRRRAEGRAAGVRRRPELRLPDLRRGRARRPRPVRPADQEGRRRGARAGRPPGAALPVRARPTSSASTTSTAPTAGSTRSARPPGWSRASATSRRSTRSPASSPA